MNVTLRLAGLWLATWSLAVCGGGASDEPVPQPSPQQSSWTLSWSDEFDAGSQPDESRWVYDLGGGGWGNQELQTYTSRADNAVVRDGALVITARAERLTGTDGIVRDYTSARLKTKDRFAETYGRFEARIRLPRGEGLWPAFWMLGADLVEAGWPRGGEIDIMDTWVASRPRISGPSTGLAIPEGGEFASPIHDGRHLRGHPLLRWNGSPGDPLVLGRPSSSTAGVHPPTGARWVFDHASSSC